MQQSKEDMAELPSDDVEAIRNELNKKKYKKEDEDNIV